MIPCHRSRRRIVVAGDELAELGRAVVDRSAGLVQHVLESVLLVTQEPTEDEGLDELGVGGAGGDVGGDAGVALLLFVDGEVSVTENGRWAPRRSTSNSESRGAADEPTELRCTQATWLTSSALSIMRGALADHVSNISWITTNPGSSASARTGIGSRGHTDAHPDQAVLLVGQDRLDVGPRRDRDTRPVGGDLHAGAVAVEVPAVVRADEAAVLDPALREAGAAVRALVHRGVHGRVGLRPPGHVVVAEDAERVGLGADLAAVGDRVPVLPEGGDLADQHGGLLGLDSGKYYAAQSYWGERAPADRPARPTADRGAGGGARVVEWQLTILGGSHGEHDGTGRELESAARRGAGRGAEHRYRRRLRREAVRGRRCRRREGRAADRRPAPAPGRPPAPTSVDSTVRCSPTWLRASARSSVLPPRPRSRLSSPAPTWSSRVARSTLTRCWPPTISWSWCHSPPSGAPAPTPDVPPPSSPCRPSAAPSPAEGPLSGRRCRPADAWRNGPPVSTARRPVWPRCSGPARGVPGRSSTSRGWSP